MNNQFNDQPLVSIIMNCYNGETYLQESIKCVLSQTYENWELIFWDNRSKDKSAEIFKGYEDKRFKYQNIQATCLFTSCSNIFILFFRNRNRHS